MPICPEDKLVGRRIRQRRHVQHLSQADLGNSIGVKFQQVQKYETGANRVSASRLVDLAKALDVSISYFFEGLAQVAPKEEIKTADEHRLLALFRQSTTGAQTAILNIAQQTAQPSA